MDKMITEFKWDSKHLEKLRTLGEITGVAIISHEGKVISMLKPNRHHHVFKYMHSILKHPTPITGQEGFITSDGTFVDRVSAKYIASRHNQLLPRASKLDELFSKCVW